MKNLNVFVLLLLFAGSAAAQQSEPLVIGQTYERSLEPGAAHVYTLPLEADWFASGRVDQREGAVTVTVTGPDDAHVDRFEAPAGPNFFRFATDAAGTHRIQVSAASETEAARYVLRVRQPEPVATTPEGKVDQMMAMFGGDTPGALVAVIRDGELAFARGYGMANLGHDVPFTAETRTNIGSTSKQFTAFALALLADRGQLSLDDDVRKHIPELPDFGETVTLRNLLTHTSGYREFVNTLVLAGRQVLEADHISPDEILEVVQRQPRLQNRPGEEFNYNNTGYALAAMTVERVSGLSFPEWMDREVFTPLGMENTFVREHPGQIIANRSVGYLPAADGFRETPDLGASMGAGGIYTTAGDLARWMRNLHTAELGGAGVMHELTTRSVLIDGDTTDYGLGLFIDNDRGLSRIHHGGADIAHRSTFVYYPELQAGYLVQSNYSAIPGSIGRGVAEAFFGDHMVREDEPEQTAEEFAPEMLDRELLDAYAGRYELEAAPGTILTVSREGDQLRLETPGQSPAELDATSDSTFTIPGMDIGVTFHRDEGGAVDRLTLHQNGNHLARRLDDAPAVALDEYPGRYFSEELETFYHLALDDGELNLRHRRFGPVPLAHTQDDDFSASFPLGTLSFERDSDGRVTGFRVGNGRARDIWFEKRD